MKQSASPSHDTSDVRVPAHAPQLSANGMPVYERLLSKNELYVCFFNVGTVKIDEFVRVGHTFYPVEQTARMTSVVSTLRF